MSRKSQPLGRESEFSFAVYVFAAFYVVHGATARNRADISLSNPRVPKLQLQFYNRSIVDT